MKELKKNQKGFTLVELVIVIAILAVLATLIVPRIMENIADAREQTAIGNARTLAGEISVWNAKQPTNATWITDGSDADSTISSDEFDDHLTLPAGLTWPSNTIVDIVVDANGNASVTIH